MLPEKLRDALEAIRHGTGPDDLHTGFINGMHINSRATLFLEFTRETNMVGMMVGEYHCAELVQGKSNVF